MFIIIIVFVFFSYFLKLFYISIKFISFTETINLYFLQFYFLLIAYFFNFFKILFRIGQRRQILCEQYLDNHSAFDKAHQNHDRCYDHQTKK